MDIRIKQPGIRILQRPGQSLRSLAERRPEAEAFAEGMAARAAEKLRPTATLLYSIRRRLATAGVTLLTVWLFVHVMFGANGMVVYRQKKTEYQSLVREVDGLQKENDSYTARIEGLKTDPKTIEKEAREQLHYTRPGEVVFVAPSRVTVQKPMVDSAQK
jgi:cell division protein FtsB